MGTKLLILAGFLVAFAAGLVVGVQNRQIAALNGPGSAGSPAVPTTGPATRPNHHRGGMLTEALGLSPDQQNQLNAIWSEIASQGRERDDARRQARKERDDAIVALIRSEDQPKYQQILETFTQRQQAIDEQWRSAYQSAVERTKALLTPDQRTKYEELLKRNQWDRGDRGGPRGGERGGEHGGMGPGGGPPGAGAPGGPGGMHVPGFRGEAGPRAGERATTRPGPEN
jgi:Spy/CpxP family protein refolding chaperone